MISPHLLVFQSPQGSLLTWFCWKKSVGFWFCYSSALCFYAEIRQVPNTILPLPFPPSQIHVFTLGLRLKGQEHTGEVLLVVKREMQENKLETRGCLSLCLQDTFVNTPLAQTSHKPSTISICKKVHFASRKRNYKIMQRA